MQFYPLEFETLTGLAATSSAPAKTQPMDIPAMVITMMPNGPAKLAVSSAGEVPIKHGDGFLFGDQFHDWAVRDGKFYFFAHDLAPAGQKPEAQAQKADVLVVYKWMEIDMDANGDPEGRSTLKAMRHGYSMSIEIKRAKGAGKWEATYSQPSLSMVPLDKVEDVSRAQIALADLAMKELARRVQNDSHEHRATAKPGAGRAAAPVEAESTEAPAPG